MNATTTAPKTDPSLWTTRPVHGVAGGPIEVCLTDEGSERAFAVGAQVRRTSAGALAELATAGGVGALSERIGSTVRLTHMGRHAMHVWGVLMELGYCERWYDASGDGVRLTDAGRAAVDRGYSEQASLLERCRRAASEAR